MSTQLDPISKFDCGLIMDDNLIFGVGRTTIQTLDFDLSPASDSET